MVSEEEQTAGLDLVQDRFAWNWHKRHIQLDKPGLFFLFQFLKTQIKRGQIVLFFTLLLFTFHQLCPCFLVYFYLIWGVMCSSAPSLDYDSRKQLMFSISSLVTVWTNWNRTQNSICAVLGPATTSRLLSSAFFYSFFLCMANKTPLVTNTHQAGEPEKVPLHRQRCSLCVFGWIWRSWDQIWIFFHVVIARGASSHPGGKESLTGL